VIERAARDRLAELARHLAAGTCTNDQFEDRAWPVIERSADDPAVRMIFNAALGRLRLVARAVTNP
jgi:hypothetical protein